MAPEIIARARDRIVPVVYEHTPRTVKEFFGQRYVSGDSLEDIIRVTEHLLLHNYEVMTDVLGESPESEEQETAYLESYFELIELLEDLVDKPERGLIGTATPEMSLKLTGLGMKPEEKYSRDETVYERAREIVLKANQVLEDSVVWLDMEESDYTDRTIEMYKRLHEEFPGKVGIAIQTYLKERTSEDLERLLKLSHAMIRLVNGIYTDEPDEIAEKDPDVQDYLFKTAVQQVAQRISDQSDQEDVKLDVATHKDTRIQSGLDALERKVTRDSLRFALLYGVRPELARDLKSEGHRVAIYVPGGEDWEPYVGRRAEENPQFITDAFVAAVRGLLRGEGIKPKYV